MTPSSRLTPARLLALFVVLGGVPLVALGWLGWHVMQQDRALDSQRLRERLEDAASLIARELDRSLADWDTLASGAALGEPVALPDHAVFLLIGGEGVDKQQGVNLPYYPRVAATTSIATPFSTFEAHEFRNHDLGAAMAGYRELTRSTDPAIRADALLRLARVFRKQRRIGDAIAAYDELAALTSRSVANSPAELVARRERIVLFNEVGDVAASGAEAARLGAALADGRFRIDHATFDFFTELAAMPQVTETPLAQAVEALWPLWHEQRSGRAAWTADTGSFVAVWRQTPTGRAAIAGRIDDLISPLGATTQDLRVQIELSDATGRRAWGEVASAARVTKANHQTGLPWTIHVAATDGAVVSASADARRNLFIGGFALMTLVIVAASFVVFRSVGRELAVARLQSDFVAAVSHEFRTPLTAMCHLTELLEEGGAATDRLPDYYRALGKESRRLHTIVEQLLDFGRIDAGRREYELTAIDSDALVERVVQEFREHSPREADRIVWALPAAREGTLISADAGALAMAIRNLIDNALKYSHEPSPVRVSVTSRDGRVAISVEDEGPGLSARERSEVFQKFARGAAARALNVKGTGIGLTMADQIVRAHRGRVELRSEPGRGSSFTIVLPAAKPSEANAAVTVTVEGKRI